MGGRMNAMILRHYWIRLRTVAQDPVALSMLALAGLASLLPTYRLALWRFESRPSQIGVLVALHLIFLLLWAPLAALPVVGTAARSARAAAGGRMMPALPIGPRERALAEALVALTFVLLARTPALLLYGTDVVRFSLPLDTFGHGFSAWMLFCIAFVRESLLFAVVALPLLIAWCAVPRLDAVGQTGIAILTMTVAGATLAGLTYLPWLFVAFSFALSALVLGLVGLEWHLPSRRSASPRSTAPVAPIVIPWRPSPGPLGQFRRDQVFGPLFRPGVSMAVGVAIPLALALQATAGGLRTRMGMALTAFFLLLSANLLVFPIGVRLVPSSNGGAASLFSGRFADAWAALPVRREQVLRAVYAHAWVVSCLVCLCFCGIVMGKRGASSALLFELPGLPLTAAFVLCAAAGDRPRGSLALGCLLAFQFVIPVMSMAAYAVGLRDASPSGLALYLPGYILALIGGLPPLIHLRAPRPLARAAV